MDEDPRYLRNQSRAIHRMHRRSRAFGRWFMVLWLALVGAWTAIAAVDVAAGLGWEFEARHVWAGLLMVLGGCGVWLFATLIDRVLLALGRRQYGPEPEGSVER